jgi:hypothetical protein
MTAGAVGGQTPSDVPGDKRGLTPSDGRMKRVAIAALVLAALTAGCGGHHGASKNDADSRSSPSAHRTGGDRTPSPSQQLQALVVRRARALGAGDAGAYAATSLPRRRARDRRAARDARRVGVTGAQAGIRRAEVQGRRATLHVVEAYTVRGIRGAFRATRTLRAVRHRGAWLVSGVAGARSRPPWEVAAYRRDDLPHFVLLAPAAVDVRAAGLPDALAAGYARIADALPRAHLRRRYLAVVAADAAAARALTARIGGLGGLAAVADTAVRQSGPAERVRAVLSQRLLVVWPAFSTQPAEERRRVVAHELTHLVLAGRTSGRTPSWLLEGIALYVSGDQRSDEAGAVLRGAAGAAGTAAAPALDLRRLSGRGAIARLRGSQQAGAYAYASAAAFAIADRYGSRALLRLYDAFGDPSLHGRPGAALTDRAMRRTLGVGLGAFERRLRASLP